jgi:hypothetical protein
LSIKQLQFRIVCVRHTLVFTEEDYNVIRKIVEAAKPDYWHFFDPDIIYTYFAETTKKAENASNLTDELSALLKSDHRFYGVGISMLSGEISVNKNFWGKIKTPPAGAAVEEVSKMAYEEAIKNG